LAHDIPRAEEIGPNDLALRWLHRQSSMMSGSVQKMLGVPQKCGDRAGRSVVCNAPTSAARSSQDWNHRRLLVRHRTGTIIVCSLQAGVAGIGMGGTDASAADRDVRSRKKMALPGHERAAIVEEASERQSDQKIPDGLSVPHPASRHTLNRNGGNSLLKGLFLTQHDLHDCTARRLHPLRLE